MSNRVCVMLVLVIMLLVLTATACGKDEDDNKDGLSETFTSSTGISVRYPQGWGAKEEIGQIFIANSQEAMEDAEMTTGQFGIMVTVLPADWTFSPRETLERSNKDESGGSTTYGDIFETQVGGKSAARITMSGDKVDGVLFAIDLGGSIAIGGMTAAKGELKDYEAIGMDIIASISYTAPTQ